MRILVLSPHADDAVLSCADHILQWKNSNIDVTLCTIFSKFNAYKTSRDANILIADAGLNSVQAFEKMRITEDQNAANVLKLNLMKLNFTDGLFRVYKKQFAYPLYQDLFRNKVSLLDKQLIEKLNVLFKTFSKQYDFIVTPLGFGRHVDHLITFTCANQSIDANRLVYYFDAPYFFHLYNWNMNSLKKFKNYKLSIKWSSNRKIMAFNCYKSQKHVLLKLNQKIFFNNKIIFFPELVLLPKSLYK